MNSIKRRIKEKFGWDVFNSSEAEATSTSEKTSEQWKTAYKLLKLLTIIVVFSAVLGCVVISKGALLFAVSQFSEPDVKYCDAGKQPGQRPSVYLPLRAEVAWIWVVFFAYMTPELFTFLGSLRTMLMRSFEFPGILEFLTCLTFETLHTVGVGILVFIALPALDSLRGLLLMNAVCIIPAIIKLFVEQDIKVFGKKIPEITCKVLTGISILMQLSALMVWPVVHSQTIDDEWAIPVGLFLTSFGWWEPFVAEIEKPKFITSLWDVKTKMVDGGARAPTYAVISVIKIGLMFGCMLLMTGLKEPSLSDLFTEFNYSFSTSDFLLIDGQQVTETIITRSYIPAFVLVTQIMCSWGAYYFAKFACTVGIQEYSFALPLTLATPLCLLVLSLMCTGRQDDSCMYENLPKHLFFNCPADTGSNDWLKESGWVWAFWFVSQFWLTIHIWFPKNGKLSSAVQMFSTPQYNGLLMEQSLMLNRRADDGKDSRRHDYKKKHFKKKGEVDEAQIDSKKKKKKISLVSEQNHDFEEIESKHETTRIYGCATMWHESEEEMQEMLKSIFRIDDDYFIRNIAKDQLGADDPDYYEWETHIFFDDCMERSSYCKDEFIVNQFVQLLLTTVEACGKKWYGSRNPPSFIDPPEVIITPYGGRLVWHLPGKTKIFCHLKDKNKIRHKKRWSQCMYMYYFLGYQLMDNNDLTDHEKEVRAENTYLLALDGDVDFQPDAILKLVDLMKRNPQVGAACGRIHPIGSGYMQWYQMFEYAIGHWLQKATEHMMGCVLCSPGCFSLFRAKAVMDENVMHKYTTVAKQAKHYVQYDQGEDRWLCTLLLQRGWRVEYSAASDSFTACPEGFKEFYNQRRRWMPSTLANIADLLSDYRNVVAKNDDISYFYIFYQVMMMVGTILGPGSIFLMLVGAFNIAFKISMFESLMYNFIIIAVYVLICCFFKADHQVFSAMVLSLVYAMIMMAVLVGLILQVTEDGPLAPTTLSLAFVAGSFVLAGILHPQEFGCLPMGVIYYITIPSMYLLLMIYSIFNLNNVSWGTREVPKSAADIEAEQEKNLQEATKKVQANAKADGLLGFFTAMNEKKKGTLEFSCGNICSWLWFTKDDENNTNKEIMMIADKLDKIEKALNIREPIPEEPKEADSIVVVDSVVVDSLKNDETKHNRAESRVRFHQPRDEENDPYWLENNEENKQKCKLLLETMPKHLPQVEKKFWNGLIEEYLKPLEENKEEKKRVQEDLKDLKNQMVLSFLILNSIWVIAIFLFQQNKDMIFIMWPWGAKGPTLDWDRTQSSQTSNRVDVIQVEYEYLELEPIGVTFMVFFALVMLIQVIGMILHRIMTLGHIVVNTKLWSRHSITGYVDKHGRDFIKELARDQEDDHGATTMEEKIEKQLQKIGDMDDTALSRRMSSGTTLRRRGRSSHNEVFKEIGNRHKQTIKRRETMRKSRNTNSTSFRSPPITIQEEDEGVVDHVVVERTKSKIDPNGFIESIL